MSESRSGYIYLVQMEGSNLYKIGRTKDVPRRMSEFGLLLPFQYELIACCPVADAPEYESKLHHVLRSKRRNGEWFLLAEQDVKELRAMMLFRQAAALHDRLNDMEPVGETVEEYYGSLEKILRVELRAVRRILRRDRALTSLMNEGEG